MVWQSPFYLVLTLCMCAAGVLALGSGAFAQSDLCPSTPYPSVQGRGIGGSIGFGVNPFNIGSPSPTAASIGRLAVADVAIQTGAATVSIPLYEVRNRGGFTVPITLEYHSNGLKVDDIAGWVGAGWTLNAGGVVTRSVVGGPDEDPNTGYPIMRDEYDFGPNTNYTDPDLVYAMYMGGKDFQPDFFAFSGPDLSGRFVWHDFEEFRVIPHQPVEISRTISSWEDWVWHIQKDLNLTYQYTFPEKTNPPGGFPPYTTSWFLTEIVHPGGNINFGYVNRSQRFQSQVSSGQEFRNIITGSEGCWALNGGGSWLSSSVRDDVVLTSIESDDVLVEFYSSARDFAVDLFNSQELSGKPAKLDSIRVFDINGHALIRTFVFEYVYQHSVAGSWQSSRMFLDSVTEIGHDGEALPPYRFEYVGIGGGFPVRLAFPQQDDWGYAKNGGMGGLLRIVNHPTGGYELIEYEPNVYQYGPISGSGRMYTGQRHALTVVASYDEEARGELTDRDTFIVTSGTADSTLLHVSYSVFSGKDDPDNDRYVQVVCSNVYDSGRLYDDGELAVMLPDNTPCVASAAVADTDVGNPDARTYMAVQWHEWGEMVEALQN